MQRRKSHRKSYNLLGRRERFKNRKSFAQLRDDSLHVRERNFSHKYAYMHAKMHYSVIVISRKLSPRCRINSCYWELHMFLFYNSFFFLKLIYLLRASYLYQRETFYTQCTCKSTYIYPESRPIYRRVEMRAAPLCHFKFETTKFHTVESSNRNFAPTAEACTLRIRKLHTIANHVWRIHRRYLGDIC